MRFNNNNTVERNILFYTKKIMPNIYYLKTNIRLRKKTGCLNYYET